MSRGDDGLGQALRQEARELLGREGRVRTGGESGR